MVDFSYLSGDLYVGKSAENDDRIDTDYDDQMFDQVIFRSDPIDLRFYMGIGGYIPLRDRHIVDEYGDQVFYPHYNETVVEPVISNSQDVDLYRSDVSIVYSKIEGDMYLRSQCDITAYGGMYIVAQQEVYKIIDPLLTEPTGTSERDEFLEVESVEEPLRVKNVRTGTSVPVTADKVYDLVENHEETGALKVTAPDTVLTQAFQSL